MTPDEIKAFNNSYQKDNQYDHNQGIYSEPNGIPVHIKEPVMYMRYEIGGIEGGSCWEDSDPQPYTKYKLEDEWKALDKFLSMYCPNISYLNYKKIDTLIHTNEETDWEYYGNCTEYRVKYIKLKQLETFIQNL